MIDILRRHGFETYAVDSCVRDMILARTPEDWDLTTSAKPAQIKEIFHHTVDTGIEHGTVTVLIDDDHFEVTTYRVDGNYSDGRHPDSVTFTPSLKEDLRRRDFTINAMAYNEKLGLVDFYGGMDDLQNHVIRCVGNADERFDEDALRILRAVRFAAQLGFKIDEKTYAAISTHTENLRMVSAERIRVELVKLLISQNPMTFGDLYTLGITKVIMPEFDLCVQTPQNTPHHIYNVGEHTLRTLPVVPPDEIMRLTMLMHDFGKPAARYTDSTGRDHFKGHAAISAQIAHTIMRRLRFDNLTTAIVTHLIEYHDYRPEPNDSEVRLAMHLIGRDLFSEYLTIQRADTSAKSLYQRDKKFARIEDVNKVYMKILGRGDPIDMKDLAINGNDVSLLGIRGKEIGRVLKAALLKVLEDPSMNDRKKLLEFVQSEAEKDAEEEAEDIRKFHAEETADTED